MAVAVAVAVEEGGDAMIATGRDRRRVAGAEAVLAEEEDVGTSESETSTVATHRRLSGHLRSAGGATAVRMDPPCRRSTIGAAPRPPAAGATTTPADPRSARGAIRPRPIARRGRGGGGGGRTARPGPGTGATPRDRRRRATVAGGGATPARRRGATPARRPRIPQQSGSAEAEVAEAVAGAAGAGGGGGRSSPRSEGAAAEAVLDDEATKDQRTIFVSQLVMRADERDISRYFRRKVGISEVRDVILLRDRRTGRHKGCAYVEVGRLEDVDRALGATGKTPDFQRFPILVKRAEAEKNALALGDGAVTIGSLSFIPPSSVIASALVNHGGQPVQLSADGMRIEAQKVYVGSIEPCVTQPQLHAVFSQFGTLEKILLQTDASTGMSRGFAFLTYRDPKDANLAIQTMSGQMLAGRPL